MNGKYGDLFKIRDIDELAYKINEFLSNPKILQKKVILGKKIINKFLIKNCNSQLEKNIEKLF